MVGIDTGVNTGLAIWDRKDKKFVQVSCLKIHEAMQTITHLEPEYISQALIRVEDARKRTWFSSKGREALQGAGSIKRDAVIWEDFLSSLKVRFEMVAPKANKTKLPAERFNKLTGWDGRTNEHARDAAILCFGY